MSNKCPKCNHENSDDTLFCGKCGTPLPIEKGQPSFTKTLETPVSELTRGTLFADRYEIIEELGKGGMGRVYRVEDTKLKQEVALKLIKPEIASDKKTIERFRNELKLARNIRHKNVCGMYDLGEKEGAYFITMEYIRGEDLKNLIRKMGQLSAGQAIAIAKQVCDGLNEAHRLGVVHRDLKPQNIMIDKDGNARIMDFGIARSLRAKGITGSGVMIGTPEYMSPEQVDGKETDQRADIYSLGIILYEMVTGRVPFEGDTPFSIGVKQKSETPRPPKKINEQIPEDLNRVILKCMEKDKEKRYQSVGELHSELMNLEKGIPTTERIVPERKPITSREITVQFSLKKLLIPACIAIAAVIVGLILWHPWSQEEAEMPPLEKPSVAIVPFNDISPERNQGYLCEGIAESLISALSKIKDLHVPASASSFLFRGDEINFQEIGENLNVSALLYGSLQKSGNTVRITAKLVNVADESILWSDHYDEELEDIFAIQDKITLAIVDNLKLRLLGEEKEKLVKRYTDNLKAYTLYIKGRLHWKKRGLEDLMKAIEYFESAIKEDSNYALGYVGLADSYIILAGNGYLPPKECYPKAREAALKALEIDNTLAEAHASIAAINYGFDWDWEASERAFMRAIELNPGYASAHHWYAIFLTIAARFDDAIREIKLAQELDPLSPRINVNVGHVLIQAQKYDQAIESLEEAIEMFPDHRSGYSLLGQAYLLKSKYEEALDQFQKIDHRFWIGITYAKMGKKIEAQKVLDDLIMQSELSYVRPFSIAEFYFALGEIDQGFEWLEKGYQERGDNIYELKVYPFFDSVRSDPRFTVLLKKMNLE